MAHGRGQFPRKRQVAQVRGFFRRLILHNRDMPSWPFTRLHIGKEYSIAISGPFIQVINSEDGKILRTVRCDVVVTNSAVDDKFVHLATVGDDKKLKVWDIASLQLRSTRVLHKKATQVGFFGFEAAGAIIVADKFGDVFSYPLMPRFIASTTTSGRVSLTSHENPHGDLILGHASIITCFTFSVDWKYIITADRDEHIRASRFPNGYIVERYCLGHEHFVSAVNIPFFNPSVLISGGGDPYLSVWNWKTGQEKCRIRILEPLKPYLKGPPIRVKLQKRQIHRTAKRRRNEKEVELEEEQEVELSVDVQHEPSEDDNEEIEQPDDVILVVKKIVTIQVEKDRQLIMFSATGGSALCYCQFTEDPNFIPDVRQLNLNKPILDFEVTTDNRIVVTVDPNWTPPGTDVLDETILVFMIEWGDNELRLSPKLSLLVEALNGQVSQTASAHEIAAMRLYDDLELLPKRPNGPEEDETNSRPSTPTPSPSSTSAPTNKMAARLKKQSHIRQQQGMSEIFLEESSQKKLRRNEAMK